MIPQDFEVKVKTPEPLTVKIDVSEKTMMLGAFVIVIGSLAFLKLKKKG